MTTLAASGPAQRPLDRWLVAIAVLALALALPGAAAADHAPGQNTIHKEVVAVNGEPLSDPEDPSDPISVRQGDTVTYRISITAGRDDRGAEATIEDNFTPSEQEFVDATGGDCSLSEEGNGTKLTCEVTLDDDGTAVVDATFRMVAEAPEEGEGCPTVQNVATVKTQDFEPRPSNQTMVEVCAAEDGGEVAAAGGAADDRAGAVPDTAAGSTSMHGGPLAGLLAVLLVIGLSLAIAHRRPHTRS